MASYKDYKRHSINECLPVNGTAYFYEMKERKSGIIAQRINNECFELEKLEVQN